MRSSASTTRLRKGRGARALRGGEAAVDGSVWAREKICETESTGRAMSLSQLQPPPTAEQRAAPKLVRDSWASRRRTPGAGRVAIVAAVLAVAIVGSILVGSGSDPATRAAPAVITRLEVGGNLDQLAIGFGSVWASDHTNGRIVRVDLTRRRVVAQIPAREVTSVNVGVGATWANAYGELVRVDPRTGHVTRIPVQTPDGEPYKTFDVYPNRAAVWLVQPERAIRIDPRTLTIRGTTRLTEHGLPIKTWSASRAGLWTVTAADRIERRDWHTGRRTASVPTPVPSPTGIVAGDAAVLIINDDREIARVDPRTGRPQWRTRLDVRVTAAAVQQGFLFAKGADPTRPRDMLLKVDLATGRIVARLAMSDLGSWGRIGIIGDQAWLTAAGGKLVAVRL
jgi:hypothetical protein